MSDCHIRERMHPEPVEGGTLIEKRVKGLVPSEKSSFDKLRVISSGSLPLRAAKND